MYKECGRQGVRGQQGAFGQSAGESGGREILDARDEGRGQARQVRASARSTSAAPSVSPRASARRRTSTVCVAADLHRYVYRPCGAARAGHPHRARATGCRAAAARASRERCRRPASRRRESSGAAVSSTPLSAGSSTRRNARSAASAHAGSGCCASAVLGAHARRAPRRQHAAGDGRQPGRESKRLTHMYCS